MTNKIKFWPVRGKEDQILRQDYYDGKLYFATDTNKIYLDVDGSRHLMGGNNSGIIYANGNDSNIVAEDEDSSIYTIEFSALENSTIKPVIDSLVLNSDGRFFRVTDVGITSFTATLLAVSGSGGGGGGNYSVLFIDDIDNNTNKYFTLDATDAVISFKCSSSIELNNRIESITYDFGKGFIITDDISHNMGETISFNLSNYLDRFSLNATNTFKITVKDSYQTVKSLIYYINILELTLSSNFNQIYKINKNSDLIYYCTPKGGSKLTSRELQINLYSKDNLYSPVKVITQTIQSSGVEITKTISTDDLPHGEYLMTAQMVGEFEGNLSTITLKSNLLSYNIIVFDEANNTPILSAIAPSTTLEQYSIITIPYMLVYSNVTGKSEIISKIDLIEKNLSVDNNVINYWTISLDSVGVYNLELRYSDSVYIQFPAISVTPYQGEAPVIDETLDSLKLNLKVENRSNDETNRDHWDYSIYNGILRDFKWGDVNGWTRDKNNVECLKLTSGANLEIDYHPFKEDAGILGRTIELDFMVSGVTDYSKPLISCLSYNNEDEIFSGLRVTGQEATLNSELIHTANAVISENEEDESYNTKIQALTNRFTENERMHISLVIGRKTTGNIKPLIYTYLNGVISGITEYDNNDHFEDMDPNNPSKIIIDSSYGDIYIYNIRVYEAALDKRIILNNYLATLPTLADRVSQAQWNNIVSDSGSISLDLIEREDYNLKIPYILLTGGHAGSKSAQYSEADNNYHLPFTKKDYRLMSMEYYDPNDSSKNFVERLHLIDSIGNSTYDINEADSSYYADSGVLVYGQGTSSMEYPVKNLRIKLLNSKFQVYKDGYPVNLLCLKADYMESSGSHNTGTGNLLYTLYNNLGLKTPAQEFYENLQDEDYNYKYVTAIRGYPTVIFYRPNENSEYEFVGKYNLNLDKATQEPFGFFDYDKNGQRFGLNENNDNIIHCVEWLNNASALCNFLGDSSENPLSIEDYFDANWSNSFEGRYPDGEDLSTVQSFKNLIAWINSTDINSATNNSIESTTYDNIEYAEDSVEYRLAKFKNEIWNYMNKDFTLFYYVLTHILLMIDSRAKNMMMATWDDQHWYPIFYDMDTMLGLNNYGYNKFNYDIEDTTTDIYNGQRSVLWNNLRRVFADDIAEMYNRMRNNGLNYNNLISIYNEDLANAWNEALCNADAQYKYVRPYIEGYWNGISGQAEWVEEYGKSYMYAAQGRRSFHRQWWLSNRLNYFDGKYLADAVLSDNLNFRIYSPLAKAQAEGEEIDSRIVASVNAVPPDASFTLTPFKNGYLSVAYGGTNGYVTAPQYAAANTSITIYPNPNDNSTDTETYVCSASQLKDVGDLSNKYLGNFDISKVKDCKLTRLILGNHHPNYYNKYLSEATIGNTCPYLEEIDITNTELTGLDISNCLRIQKVFAAGSKLTNINLPSFGVIEELRLPKTIQNLILDNQTLLRDFSIGDLEVENNIENYVDANQYNLTELIVKNTPINSYPLVMKSANLRRYLLTDVDWYITSDSNIENGEISVLEKLKTLNVADLNVPRNLALTGTLTIGIDNVSIDAYEIYNKYHDIYPNLIIQYDTENHPTMNLSDVININFLTHSGTIQTFVVLPKNPEDERRNIEGFYSNILNGVETPFVPSTISTTFTFNGVWNYNNVAYTKSEIETLLTSLNEDANFIPQFTESVRKYHITFYDGDDNILTDYDIDYGSFITNDKMPSAIPYKDDSELALTQTYRFKGYTTTKNSSSIVDVQQIQISKDWNFYPVFRQQSVYEEATSSEYFNFVLTDYVDTSYNPEVGDSKYNLNGWSISIKPNIQLKGKITLPSYYQGKPVIIINNNFGRYNGTDISTGKDITHIFWRETSQEPCSLRLILENAFSGKVGFSTALQYIELPNSLRTIRGSAFFCAGNVTTITPVINGNPELNSIILPESLVQIGTNAFNGTFKPGAQINKIAIPSMTYFIGWRSFKEIDATVNEVTVGTQEKGSNYLKYNADNNNDTIINSISGQLPQFYGHRNNRLTSSFIFYYNLSSHRDAIMVMFNNGCISDVDNLSCVQANDFTS